MVVGRLLSYWEGNFSGAMLNFGEVSIFFEMAVYCEAWPVWRRPWAMLVLYHVIFGWCSFVGPVVFFWTAEKYGFCWFPLFVGIASVDQVRCVISVKPLVHHQKPRNEEQRLPVAMSRIAAFAGKPQGFLLCRKFNEETLDRLNSWQSKEAPPKATPPK